MQRADLGRTARARHLISRLFIEIPSQSPAFNTLAELYRLFNAEPPKNIQQVLSRIPAASDAERAKRIGISRQWYSELWHRHHKPSPRLAKRIAKLAGVTEDEVR